MDIEGQIGFAGDRLAELDHLQLPARNAADLGVGLDPAHQVRVLARDLGRSLDVHLVRPVERGVEMAFKAADQIGGKEAEHAAFGWLGDERAKAGQGHAARTALIDDGGHAGFHANHVGSQAKAAGHVLIDVRVGVDHAGDDQLARDVDHLPRGGGGNGGLDRDDPVSGDRDIEASVAAARGIDHPAATQQQIHARVHL